MRLMGGPITVATTRRMLDGEVPLARLDLADRLGALALVLIHLPWATTDWTLRILEVESSSVKRRTRSRPSVADATVAVVVLTYNRVHLLSKCVENVLRRTSRATREIVIWNNGSTDGTRGYLDALDDDRLIVVHNDLNIGQNAYEPEA